MPAVLFLRALKPQLIQNLGFFIIKEKMQCEEDMWTTPHKQEPENMLHPQDSVSLAFFLKRWVMFKF